MCSKCLFRAALRPVSIMSFKLARHISNFLLRGCHGCTTNLESCLICKSMGMRSVYWVVTRCQVAPRTAFGLKTQIA